MVLGYRISDCTLVDVKVDLSGGDGTVPEHFLNKFNICAFFEQQLCKSMTDQVWGDEIWYSSHTGEFFQKKTDALR